MLDQAGKIIANGKLYMRGVIDKAAEDLKRWIKTKGIRTTSIFGIPKFAKTTRNVCQG